MKCPKCSLFETSVNCDYEDYCCECGDAIPQELQKLTDGHLYCEFCRHPEFREPNNVAGEKFAEELDTYVYNCTICHEVLVSSAKWDYDYCLGCGQIFCNKCLTLHTGSCSVYAEKLKEQEVGLATLCNQAGIPLSEPKREETAVPPFLNPPEPIDTEPLAQSNPEPASQHESETTVNVSGSKVATDRA